MSRPRLTELDRPSGMEYSGKGIPCRPPISSIGLYDGVGGPRREAADQTIASAFPAHRRLQNESIPKSTM